MKIRRKKSYFEQVPGSPEPIFVEVKRRVRFNEADPMAIMWHGRYPLLFEEASEELGRRCGLSYDEYLEAGLRAPIIALHIDYFQSLFLAEEFTIRASLIWHEGARINTEFHIYKQDGSLATSGYTIQLFTDHVTGEPCMVSPMMLERCRNKVESGRISLLPMKAVVVESDILTPFGPGIDACWDGLLANRTSISSLSRFSTKAFFSDCAGTIAGLNYQGEISLVMQMMSMLFETSGTKIPSDAKLLLATTKGEIDILEKCIITGTGDVAESSLNNLLRKVIDLAGTKGGGMVVSAACTSSTAAAARSAAMIRSGRADCVLVAACDSVTEFVFSGFSSLMALDKIPARPFDKNRAGLSVGEAAAYILVMSEERAVREKRNIIGEIAGWGMSDDANHMTGPSRESEGLVRAINAALDSAGITADQVGFISAHGTGTPYNDAMEMRAFHSVFKDRKVPVYSIKGGIGHTMGAAGLVEMAIAQRAQRENIVPPTVNLKEADDDAIGWVADRHQAIGPDSIALVTNAGFSGVNTAVVLA